MKVYHFTDSEENCNAIIKEGMIRVGKNVSDKRPLAHVSIKPIDESDDILMSKAKTGELFFMELEVPDDTNLELDPSEDNPNWRVYEGDLPVKVLRVRSFIHGTEDQEFTSKQFGKLFPGQEKFKFR